MHDQLDSFTLLLSTAALIALAWPHLSVHYRVWIGVPIKLHATQKLPLEVKWEETDASQLSSEQRDFLREAILGFRNAGFDVLANLRRKDEAKEENEKMGVWLIPMVNPATGDLASISMVTSKNLRALSFQVISEFADEFHIASTNRRTGASPTDSETHLINFDWVSDPATVVECHRRRVDNAGRSESRRRPLPDQILEKIAESRRYHLDWIVRSGHYFLDPSANCVRLTWRGALLWRLRTLPAIKRRIIRQRVAKARQLWNELGMDEWKPSHVSEHASNTIGELPGDLSPPEDSSASLAYQSSLAPGQIRRERLNGTLILRIMLPTAAQIVERKLPDMGIAFFFAVLFISGVRHILSSRNSMLLTPWRHPPSLFRPDLALALLTLIYICMQIGKGVSRRARGTTLISVSHRGLSFSNVPDQMRSGSFQRAQIEAMIVRIDQAGLSGKVFRLQMNVTTDVRSVVLLVSRSVQALHNIRRELLRAMGILDQQEET